MVDCATAWKYWLVPLLQKNLCAEKKGSLVSTQKSGFRRNNWLVQCGGLTAHCTCNCHSLTSFFERTPGLVSGGPPEDERGGRGDHGPGMVNNSKLFRPKLEALSELPLLLYILGEHTPPTASLSVSPLKVSFIALEDQGPHCSLIERTRVPQSQLKTNLKCHSVVLDNF